MSGYQFLALAFTMSYALLGGYALFLFISGRLLDRRERARNPVRDGGRS